MAIHLKCSLKTRYEGHEITAKKECSSVFDGIDGVGKSTQDDLVCDMAAQARLRLWLTCRDPGSSELGERLREIPAGQIGAAHLPSYVKC